MRIAFIASHKKTILFRAVAEGLETMGHTVYWVTPSHRWARWLEQTGVPKRRILDITSFHGCWGALRQASAPALDEMSVIEGDSPLAMRDIMLMDRLLSRCPEGRALSYMATCLSKIKQFIETNGIRAVFSEQTWAIELCATQACRSLGIHCLTPHTVRIPDGRFAFFRGHLQQEVVEIRAVTEADIDQADNLYQDFLRQRPRPSYFYRNNRKPMPRFSWLLKMVEHISLRLDDPYDQTRPTLAELVQARLGELANYAAMAVYSPFSCPGKEGEPYILIALHKQPEASIDVLGSRFSNQIEMIRLVARSTPVTHTVWVKEHSNALGGRSPRYYAELKRIPGVRLIDPSADSFELVRRADLVITVSGTMSYEAALLNTRSVTLAKMFFGDILTQNGCDVSPEAIRGVLRCGRLGAAEHARRCIRFLAWVIAQSFRGVVGDEASNPGCLEAQNVQDVTQGFQRVLEVLCESAQTGRVGPDHDD